MSYIPIVQHKDRNAHAATNYPLMEPDEMLVTSTFMTVQGEGPFAGVRAFFIRTTGCNFGAKDIACSWCDTSFEIANGTIVKVEDLREEVASHGDPLVVLTGGEPLLQQNAVRLIEALLLAGLTVQIETNGTFLHRVQGLANTYSRLHLVCSPKQVNGRYASAPPRFEYTQALNRVQFKYVLSSDAYVGHSALPDWAGFGAADHWVSPMTVYKKAYDGEVSSIWDHELVDHERTGNNYRRAAQLVLDTPGLRFGCQLHTLMAIA